MDPSEVLDAPVLQPHRSQRDAGWEREYAAFQRLFPTLLQSYRDKFVAVHNGAVVAAADSVKDAALAAYKRLGRVSLYVGWVSEKPLAPARIPSTRNVKSPGQQK